MNTWQRSITVIGVILGLSMACFAGTVAKEEKLAGISLGQTFKSISLKPAGIIIPMPPTEVGTADTNATDDATSPLDAKMMPPNILVFTDLKTRKDVWIGESTIVLSGTVTSTTQKPASSSPSSAADTVTLPAWAYSVRTGALDLNQKQYIYKINSHYSIGVTITEKSGVFVVTDIVACSFRPLATYSKELRTKPQPEYGNHDAKTTRQVKIGSSFAQIIKAYGWPPYIFPYVSTPIEQVVGDVEPNQVGVTSYSVTGSPSGMSVSPQPNLWTSNTLAGENKISFTDGKADNINAGFTRNCMVIYPDAGVAFTVAEMKIVRIQIGAGVFAPRFVQSEGSQSQPQLPSGATPTNGAVVPGNDGTQTLPTAPDDVNPWGL